MRIIYDKNNQPKSQADPYIIFAEGRYYIYATGEKGVAVYTATAIDGEWEYLGRSEERR